MSSRPIDNACSSRPVNPDGSSPEVAPPHTADASRGNEDDEVEGDRSRKSKKVLLYSFPDFTHIVHPSSPFLSSDSSKLYRKGRRKKRESTETGIALIKIMAVARKEEERRLKNRVAM